MKTMRIQVDPHDSTSLPKGRIDLQKVDATSEQNIDAHHKIDVVAAIMELKPNSGLPNADDLLIKATISSGISDILKHSHLKEPEASQLIGIAQSELSSILKAQFHNISTAKMMKSINLLERVVK